jgi:hypothetical protein
MDVSYDSKYLLTASGDMTARLWNTVRLPTHSSWRLSFPVPTR